MTHTPQQAGADSDLDEAGELGEAFFADAVLTKPGENLIDVVSRTLRTQEASNNADRQVTGANEP